MKWLLALLKSVNSVFKFLGSDARIELAKTKLEIKRPKKEARVKKKTERIERRIKKKREKD